MTSWSQRTRTRLPRSARRPKDISIQHAGKPALLLSASDGARGTDARNTAKRKTFCQRPPRRLIEQRRQDSVQSHGRGDHAINTRSRGRRWTDVDRSIVRTDCDDYDDQRRRRRPTNRVTAAAAELQRRRRPRHVQPAGERALWRQPRSDLIICRDEMRRDEKMRRWQVIILGEYSLRQTDVWPFSRPPSSRQRCFYAQSRKLSACLGAMSCELPSTDAIVRWFCFFLCLYYLYFVYPDLCCFSFLVHHVLLLSFIYDE